MLPMPAPFLSLILLAPANDGWLGIYLDPERDEAVVGEVIPDSPAERAGLRVGDVLLAVGDKATPTREQFAALVRAAKAGDRVTFSIRRGGRDLSVAVQLGQRPDAAVGKPAPEAKPARPQSPAPALESASPKARGYLGISVVPSEEGVRIERVVEGSPAAKAGLQSGDLVTRLGDVPVHELGDLEGVLAKAAPGARLTIGLRSDAGARSVTVIVGQRDSEVAAARPPVASQPVPPAGDAQRAKERDLEAEIATLRAELAELRKQVEALREGKGRD
jgi:S1-C subfamily serine protease